MKTFALALIVACKTEVVIDAGPAASSTPPSSSSSAHAFPALPRTVDALPAAWRACANDNDCVAVASACCASWPSNAANHDHVARAVAAADAAHDECRNRVCAMQMQTAACDHAVCVVR